MPHRSSVSPAVALLLALTGCPGDDERSSAAATFEVAATTDGATYPELTSTGATGTGAADVGDIDPAGVVPCTAIDVLFVVDNSSTMADEQLRLGAAAPDFIAAVRANLPEVAAVHVGVISTDSPAIAASAGRCGPFTSGLGFMTQDDDLAQALACAVQVGVGGSADERPIDMLRAAIADLANQPGGLNSDFIRKPSLLVLVIVTDEEDDHEVSPAWGSAGDPPGWLTDITASKGGIADDVVVLSLVGVSAPNACPPFQWDGKEGAELAPRLAGLTGMFRFGRVGDVCAPSYDTFFFDAVPVVAEACAGFIPVE